MLLAHNMKTLPLVLSVLAITACSLSAQVNASDQDTALRRFFGIRSIGSTVPISNPAVSAFATVLVFKDGQFWKRIGDTPILYSFGQTPVALGNPTAGFAPATVQVDFLWGPREGKMGYLFQAGVGTTGLVPAFREMPELAGINTTFSDGYRDSSNPQFEGMILLGAAYELVASPEEDTVFATIKAAKIALVVIFKEFYSEAEAKEFLIALNKKYKS
jgi:hypothetical protein